MSVELDWSFDLKGLLWRIVLFKLAPSESVLLLVAHHSIVDGWSMGVFLKELTALYIAFEKGQPSPLAELPIQYADFAGWQRQELPGKVWEAHLGYFKQQLRGELPVLDLPSDRPRPAVQTFRGETRSLLLSETLTSELKALSQQAGTTLFITLLTAFKTLLYRYTGQEDIIVGSPIANRNRPEIKGLIGAFINTLVLRTDLSGNPSFRELLQRVRDLTLQAYDRQDLPFELLLDALQPERNLSQTPLFQVGFDLQYEPTLTETLPNLTLSYFPVSRKAAKLDLTLYLVDSDRGLVCNLEYNTDLFDEGTMIRMLGHFQTLLTGIVAHGDHLIADLPLLTATQQQHLFEIGKGASLSYPATQGIHELFEAQVQQSPDAVAVVWQEWQITYQELDRRANQLARYLSRLGVKPEVLVGICVERSIEMVVGILGILKAGGAYVPLDPAYPQERLALMIEDAQLTFLLTQRQLAELLPEHEACLVFLDTDWDAIAQESPEHLASGVAAENLGLCYLYFRFYGQTKRRVSATR